MNIRTDFEIQRTAQAFCRCHQCGRIIKKGDRHLYGEVRISPRRVLRLTNCLPCARKYAHQANSAPAPEPPPTPPAPAVVTPGERIFNKIMSAQPKNRVYLTDRQIRQAHDAHYRRGYALTKIAERYGTSYNTILNGFRRLGLPKHSPSALTELRMKVIDWSALADITPGPIQRGQNVFTPAQALRIRSFIASDQRLNASMVARHFGVPNYHIDSIVNGKYPPERNS